MNFADILRDNGVPYETEGKYCRPGWVQFDCPFCLGGTDPNKPYAGYCLAYNYVNCWRCGGHGLGKTLHALTGLPWGDVRKLLDDLDIPKALRDEKPSGTLVLPKRIGPLLKVHKQYLRGRGFKVSELVKLWRIEGIGLASHLAWRIFIPIYYRGRVVSWTTRSLLESGMRYISAGLEEESIPHKTILYGEDYATNAISIHEGPTDVWRIGPGATATLGTGFTMAQIKRMARHPRRIVCFDNQPEAQQRARKICSLLEVFPGETLNVKLDAKDAGSASDKEVRRFRKLLK